MSLKVNLKNDDWPFPRNEKSICSLISCITYQPLVVCGNKNRVTGERQAGTVKNASQIISGVKS